VTPQEHTRPTPPRRPRPGAGGAGAGAGADRTLARLARLNPTGVFLAVLAFVLAGLFAPGALGGVLLLALAAGLLLLMARTWPVQAPRTRVVRLLILTLLVAVASAKLWG